MHMLHLHSNLMASLIKTKISGTPSSLCVTDLNEHTWYAWVGEMLSLTYLKHLEPPCPDYDTVQPTITLPLWSAMTQSIQRWENPATLLA